MTSADERSERPTQRRVERSRRDGDVARSHMAGAAVAIGALPAAAAALWAAGRAWPLAFRAAVTAAARPEAAVSGVHEVISAAIPMVAPPLAAALAISCASAAAATLACGAPLPSIARLAPRYRRIAPAAFFARLASHEQWLGTALGVAAGCGIAVTASIAAVHAVILRDIGAIRAAWLQALGVVVLAAVLEVWQQRRRSARALMMTKREVADERREHDGRPETKARRGALARRTARSVRLAAIRRATVVVTNPMHVAVALRYAPPAVDVPIVVARGAGFAAAAIRTLAALVDVPIVERPDLARALYAHVEIDGAIPESAFAAVAHVFAGLVREHGALRGAGEATEAGEAG